MKRGTRWAIGIGITGLIAVVLILSVRAWVVPSVLASQLRSQFHGQAHFSNWWLGRSAGVDNLSLRESVEADSPEWLVARRITTDLSLLGLLRGRFAPRSIVIEGAKLHLRFDPKGNLLTQGPFAHTSSKAAIPDIQIHDTEVTIAQEGRPLMVIAGVSGMLDRSEGGESLKFTSDDSTWGKWNVNGHFQPDFKSGSVTLSSEPGFKTTADLNARVPFVPAEVWAHVVPSGPIDVAVTMKLAADESPPIRVVTELGMHETKTALPSLGIVADNTFGKITIDEGLVRADKLEGRTLSGTIGLSGTLDFRKPTSRFDLALSLAKIDVATAPTTWQLDEAGATGRLTGTAHLLISLSPQGADLSGSSGEAVIEDATLQGFPFKYLSLAMHAEGGDLQYDAKSDKRSSWRFVDPRMLMAATLIAFQAPDVPKPPDPPRFRLPKSISTKIELEDVDLAKLIARLEVLARIRVPVPIAGHLSLKADATIPLGKLTDLQGYTIQGEAILSGASIDGVDVGRVSARFNLDKGVLNLDDLQGQLVDRPNGDSERPPMPTPAHPIDAPLVPGGFRGKLRVELSPAGPLTAHFDADELPMGELVAPYLPRPTPVAGRLTTTFDAKADAGHLGDARSWSAQGKIESHHLSYLGASLDTIVTDFTINQGRLELPDLAAKLGGRPLKARILLDLQGRRQFSGEVNVNDWAIERVLALIPGAPRPAPVSGLVDGHLTFDGTLTPNVVRSEGNVLVKNTIIESIPLGNVAATWLTAADEIQIKQIQAQPFSGQIFGTATVPTVVGQPIRFELELTKIDTQLLSANFAKSAPRLEGLASGRITATIPRDIKNLTADLTLTSPDLKIQGVSTGKVTAAIHGKDEGVEYEASADGPEGKVRFKGNLPLSGKREELAATAELQAAGFTLTDVWNLLGMKGAPAQLLGRAAIDANLQARPDSALALGLHGNVEVRDLRWGQNFPLGNFRGVLAKTPASFRLDSLRGELFGGAFSGVVWGETPTNGPVGVNFDLQTDRASLQHLFAFSPDLTKRLDGFGSLRLHGRMDETLLAHADITVPHAHYAGVALAELRIPAELTFNPGNGNGLLQARRWSARIAGGRVQGSGAMKVGVDRSFSTEMVFTDVDVEAISRLDSTAARPGSGRVTGKVSLNGPDPALPQRFRGKIELGLHDGSIGDIPVIRELGRFLGAAQGGAFEQGELFASIANQQIVIDQFTLQGRVLQIHASGNVSFDGQLDLGVLVNTNQIIPQTGQALVGLIPGFRSSSGRNEEAVLRVSNFLSNRLLKFRVVGTIKNPNVAIDPTVVVGEAATGFFSGVLKLPLGFIK